MTYRLAFRDKAGRDHMTKFDGLEANFDNVEDLLRSLLDQRERLWVVERSTASIP
jgi:hypothetical protein